MNDFELFQGTSFSDLMKDVYHNSKKKSRQIDSLIHDLKPMIKNIGDATVIAPLLKDYLEVSVKNDDALVKLEERDYLMMFCDTNMPVMSGLDLLKIVKERMPDLPVIMLTSETDIQNSISAFRYGAMDYLLKPPTVATVRGAIDKAVEFLEEEAKKASGSIDMDDFKNMVENFSPEKMGLTDSGSKNTEFSKLVNMLQDKLIHPGKIGRIHNLFLLSKSRIVIANLSANNVDQTDVDILGGMFTAVKDFMEDAVSASTTSSLNDIKFGKQRLLMLREKSGQLLTTLLLLPATNNL